MIYGRLDVYWPNGEFDTFMLEKPTVSVGRSGTCTIVLDTDTISRYHFSITKDGDTIKIADMDSANGTFIDGVQLEDNEARVLQGGEEIQIGHLRMIFHILDDQPTVPMTIMDDDTQRFVREEVGFMVDVHGPEIDIPPGSHTAVEINITNTSDESRLYTVEASGLPKGWGRINRPSLRIEPNETAQVLYSIKPARQSDSKPGDYPVIVTVANDETPEKEIEVGVTVTILPYSGFGMALASHDITLYEPVRLYVHNQGSGELPIIVSGTSQDDGLIFNIKTPKTVLKAGERKTVQGEIKPRKRDLFGKPQEHSFDILVRSQDDAGFLAAIRGKFVADPILPSWAAYAIGGLALGVIALLLAAVLMILGAASPSAEILSFTSDANPAPHNLLLQLNWSAENADGFSIRINGDVVAQNIPADETTARVDISQYNGQNITIQLVAIADGTDSDTANLPIQVIQGLEVMSFEVTPNQLYRNFITSVNISWNVNGAEITRLQGLENLLSSERVDPNPGGEANINLTGYATAPFTLTLIAEGERETTTTQSVSIDVVNATCNTLQAGYILYERPDENSSVISTLDQPNHPIILNGRDQDGIWIQTKVTTGNIDAWGRLNGLQCAEDIPVGNLRVVTNLPPIASIQPQIVSFQADRQQIPAGELLNLTWESRDATRYTLMVNDVVLQETLPADTTAAVIDTSLYAGQTLQIELIAINGDLTDSKSLTVSVAASLSISQFEFSPMQLLRHVNQNITLKWSVQGASSVTINGLDNLIINTTMNTTQPQATIDVIGYANNSFDLTLIGTSVDNQTVEQTLNIQVSDPQCMTNNPTTQGRSAPNIESPVLRTIPDANAPLTVTGRDASGSWLQSRLPGGGLAWFVSDQLTCTGFDPNQLIIVPEGTQ